MTNEEFVEEVFHIAHTKGVLHEFRDDVHSVKKSNHRLSLYDAVEIVEKKYRLI